MFLTHSDTHRTLPPPCDENFIGSVGKYSPVHNCHEVLNALFMNYSVFMEIGG